jgi:hypothetical protein
MAGLQGAAGYRKPLLLRALASCLHIKFSFKPERLRYFELHSSLRLPI